MIGLKELLTAIHEKWISDRDTLLQQSDEIIKHLNKTDDITSDTDIDLLRLAVSHYKHIYDEKHGGFGSAPKFPAAHNLLFLLEYYTYHKDEFCLNMAEHTLMQMYRGGMFDHIGFGFCRYSTDNRFLVPHFEKMLYDNALLILAYCKAYTVTKKGIYLEIAEKTADYILREMTSPEGGFFSSQDADSEGKEGKYYLFTPDEITKIPGMFDKERFNRHFDITEKGNFEGKSIPNLLKSDPYDKSFDRFFSTLVEYRKKRYSLHRDEKILTSWNSLMIAAMCELYLAGKNEKYLTAAKNADLLLRQKLCEEDTLFVSFHSGKRGVRGFLDDYASYIFAQLRLYRVTAESAHLNRAKALCDKVLSDFSDSTGGFYLYSDSHEELILRPKETYDRAIPSGNSLMCCNLVQLYFLTEEEKYLKEAEKQIDFLTKSASQYPTGYAMFLKTLTEYRNTPVKITVVIVHDTKISELVLSLPADATVVFLSEPTDEFTLKNGRTTYYVCKNHSCLPPVNDLHKLI